MAALLASCSPALPEIDLQGSCEAKVRKDLLNPETAEFHDFAEVDAEAFKAALIPQLEAEHNYPAGKDIVGFEIKQIDSAAHLYRMRVRAEGQLGNTITAIALCRQSLEGSDICHCSLLK